MNLAPIKMFVTRNSPSILMGFGIAGIAATAISTGKASIKADHILEEMHYLSDEEPTKVEKFKAVAPVFIPPVAFGILTAGCFLASNTINIQRQLALISAWSMSERTLSNTESKLSEVLGSDKKVKKLVDEVAKEDVKNNPPDENKILKTMSDGNKIIMRDGVVGGPDFETDLETLKAVFNELNNRLNSHEWVTVNDLKWALGLPRTAFWEDLGWSNGEQLEPYWSVVDFDQEGEEKDLMYAESKDFNKIYVLKYTRPTFLPSETY